MPSTSPAPRQTSSSTTSAVVAQAEAAAPAKEKVRRTHKKKETSGEDNDDIDKGGRKSPFSDAQQAFLASLLPDWEALLRKEKLHFGGKGKTADPPAVVNFVNASIDKAWKATEFKDKLDLMAKTPSEWKKVCTLP